MKTVIFGNGFVGKATAKIFDNNVEFHDPVKGHTINDFSRFDLAIICVPTPALDGRLDHSEVINCLESLEGFTGLIVIRSTCEPSFFENRPELVHWPEFLREKHYLSDSLDPDRVILGGPVNRVFTLETYLKSINYSTQVSWFITDSKTAALIKISSNAALAAKIMMFNAIREACEKTGASWFSVRSGVTSDPRIGKGQTDVPGPDGDYGFGGKCLPKDLEAFLGILEENEFVKGIIDYNKRVRKT